MHRSGSLAPALQREATAARDEGAAAWAQSRPSQEEREDADEATRGASSGRSPALQGSGCAPPPLSPVKLRNSSSQSMAASKAPTIIQTAVVLGGAVAGGYVGYELRNWLLRKDEVRVKAVGRGDCSWLTLRCTG